MTKTSWIPTSTATTYVPREKPIQESVAPFSGTISGAAPATTNLGTNSGQRILAADGTWIPQPAFTSGGADQLETLRPSVISPSYSGNPPTVTDSAKAYDVDTNHATTFGQWYAAQEARTNNRVDIFSLTTWASKTQTWTAATINVSRSYAILQDGESSATSGSSSKTSSVKYEFSTDNGSNWTTLGTDTAASIPTAPQTLSMALGSLTPTMGNILVKVTITRGGGGTIYEDGVSLPGLTGEVDLKLFDVWIDGTYAGGAGNITCNNLTVTGDATFQNKIYDSTASAGTTGQVLKVAANGKVTWATDSAGTGTVTSITTTGANGVTISGGSTQTITTSGTFALALGNITPTSISTGTGSFSGDVEFAASIKSPNGSNSPIVISPDGTGDLHVNADSLRLGDNNADATIATNGTGDLILTTHEGSATQGIIRLYDGANGNITLTPNGTGQVQVGSDQVVTLTASQTLTNKSLSGSSNTFTNIPNSATTAASANTASAIVARDASGNFSAGTITATLSGNATNVTGTVAVANGGTGSTTLTSGSYVVGNGTSAVTLKTPTQVTADLDTFTYQIGATAGKKGLVPAAPAIGGSVVYLDQTGSWTTPSGSGTTTNALTIQSPLTGTSFNGSTAVTIGLGTVAVGNGGTGLTTLTAGYIPYGSGTSAFGSSANLFWDSANSRLGVGTASPASPIHIQRSNDGLIGTFRGTSNAQLLLSVASGNLVYDASNGNAIHVFQTNTTERMRISGSQLILGNGDTSATPTTSTFRATDGSGTDVAGANLAIQGGRSTGTGTGGSITFNTAPASGTTGSSLNSPSERMRINSLGSVGIGTSSPSRIFHVTSAATAATCNFTSTATPAYSATAYNGGNARILLVGGNASGATTGIQFSQTGSFELYFGGVQESAGAAAFVWQGYSGAAYAERMRLDASGNLGIGVTPSAWVGTGNQRAIQISSIGSISSLSNATGNQQLNLGRNVYDFYGAKYISSDNASAFRMLGDNSFGWFQAPSGTAGNSITFTQAMTLDGSGNLGLGTSSPQAKLEIAGNAANAETILRGGANNFGGVLSFYGDIGGGGNYFRSSISGINEASSGSALTFATTTNGNTTPTERVRIDRNGNVGIGTSTVVANFGGYKTLELNGTTGGLLSLDSNGTNNLQMYTNGSTVNVVTIGALPLTFGTNSTERMRITSGGDVGIGRTPSYTLDLAGDARFKRNSGSGWVFQTPSSDMRIVGETSGAHLCFIPSSANVGIDTTSPSEKLNVIGKIKASDVLLGNNGTKGYGAITTTTSTSTPTGGASGDFTLIY